MPAGNPTVARQRVACFCASLLLLAAACDRPDAADRPAPAGETAAAPALPEPQQTFWNNLRSLCGQAFEGRLVDAQEMDADFAGATLVMHVRECADTVTYVPFHVGDDRSRTWWVIRTAGGLRLKHDHRHEDGSHDDITWYGGDARGPGEATRQEFPADEHTAQLLPPAATNVWTLELVPGERYVYRLRREGTDRRFEASFDLTRPVAPPPAPWGW
jgi:hypothetical protein